MSMEDGVMLFSAEPRVRTRGNVHKLEYRKLYLNMSKKVFTVRLVKHWMRLSRSIHSWRHSKPSWTQLQAVHARWPYYEQAGQNDLKRSLPTPATWCFCENLYFLSDNVKRKQLFGELLIRISFFKTLYAKSLPTFAN